MHRCQKIYILFALNGKKSSESQYCTIELQIKCRMGTTLTIYGTCFGAFSTTVRIFVLAWKELSFG